MHHFRPPAPSSSSLGDPTRDAFRRTGAPISARHWQRFIFLRPIPPASLSLFVWRSLFVWACAGREPEVPCRATTVGPRPERSTRTRRTVSWHEPGRRGRAFFGSVPIPTAPNRAGPHGRWVIEFKINQLLVSLFPKNFCMS